MAVPIKLSATGRNHTVTIVYDQPLDENSPPLVGDYTIELAAVPLNIESVIVLNVAGQGTVFVGTTQRQFPGVLAITNFTPGRLQNFAGELAPAIHGEQIVNATGATDTARPVLLAGRIDADEVSLYFDEVLDAASIPSVSAFGVKVDDVAVAATGIATIYGTRARFNIAETADTGDIASLTYTPPGAGNLRDIDGPNDVAAIGWPVLLENLTANQSGYWTDRIAVEHRWGEENTRIWSNKGDTETVDADPVAWQEALDDTDAKFNADFLTAGYDVPPYTTAELAVSPYAARFKTLAKIWAGTELYFARGLQDRTGGTDDEMRDKMQGWRNYVDAEMAKLFGAGLDIVIDEESPADTGGFQSVDIVRDSDQVPVDENSNGW